MIEERIYEFEESEKISTTYAILSFFSCIRPCSSKLRYLRPIVWYWTLKDESKVSPVRPCSLNLSYFRPIAWYCILKDKSEICPVRPFSLNLSYLDL